MWVNLVKASPQTYIQIITPSSRRDIFTTLVTSMWHSVGGPRNCGSIHEWKVAGMASYTINLGRSDAKNLEATSFDLRNDYWYFYDASERTIYVRAASSVITISENLPNS